MARLIGTFRKQKIHAVCVYFLKGALATLLFSCLLLLRRTFLLGDFSLFLCHMSVELFLLLLPNARPSFIIRYAH